MKTLDTLLFFITLLLIVSSCHVIGDIFGAGFYTGIFFVVFIVVVVLFVIVRIFRRNK